MCFERQKHKQKKEMNEWRVVVNILQGLVGLRLSLKGRIVAVYKAPVFFVYTGSVLGLILI